MNIEQNEYIKLNTLSSKTLSDNELELESRIKKNISKEEFDRCINILKNIYSNKKEHNEILDITYKGYRYSIEGIQNIKKYCKNNRIEKVPHTIIKKSLLKSDTNSKEVEKLEFNDYPIRVNLKKEENIQMSPYKLSEVNGGEKLFRLKKRFSFETADHLFRYDLTIVKSSSKDYNNRYILENNLLNSKTLQNKVEYEIEIEYIGNKNKSIEFITIKPDEEISKRILKYNSVILKAIQNNEYIMSNSDYKKTKDEYLTLIKGEKKQFIGPQPVTLEMNNIREYTDDTNLITINKNYSVTDKADGTRKLLYINNDGDVYMISTKLKIDNTGLYSEHLKNCIMDGEFITHDVNRKKLKTKLFGIFDIYYYQNKDVRFKIFSNPTSKGEFKYPEYSEGRIQILKEIFKIKNLFKQKKINNGMNIFLKHFEFDYGDDNIFEKSKNILSKTRDSLNSVNYYTDGLIYTPIKYAVGSDVEGEITDEDYYNKNNSGKTWNFVFKWKPPQDNSIDFKIEYLKEKNSNNAKIDYAHGVDNYKTVFLKVGMNTSEYSQYNCKSLYTEKLQFSNEKYKYINVNFKPTNPICEEAYIAKLKLSQDDKAYCEDGTEILDNNIIEFSYDIDNKNWIPLRTRFDKINGNDDKVANSVWSSMHNPITEEIITTGSNIPTMGESDELYWSGVKAESNTANLRDFHNLYIKDKLYKIGKKNSNLLELGVGRGGDLNRWRYAKYSFVLGIDSIKSALEDRLNGACSRYINLKKKYGDLQPNSIFVWGDASHNLNNSNDVGKDAENKYILDVLFGRKSDDEIDNSILKQYNGICSDGFDVISSQFSLHYLLKNKETVYQNLSNYLKQGGYFIGTLFDGEKIFNKLYNLEKGEFISQKVDNKIIWKITKQYDFDTFDSDKEYPIDVYFSSIGITNTENLINFHNLVEDLKQYDIKLVSKEEAKEFHFDNATGTFNELYSKLEQEPIKKKKLYGKSLNMSEIEKEYSFLNRWFIFKKI